MTGESLAVQNIDQESVSAAEIDETGFGFLRRVAPPEGDEVGGDGHVFEDKLLRIGHFRPVPRNF